MTEEVSPYSGFVIHDICEQLRSPDGKGGYNRGLAFKHLAEAGWVNPEREIHDLREAKAYIESEIERLQFNKLVDVPEKKAAKNPYGLDEEQQEKLRRRLRKLATDWLCEICGGDRYCGHVYNKHPLGVCRVCQCGVKSVEQTIDGSAPLYTCVNNHVVPKETPQKHFCPRCVLPMNQRWAGGYFCTRCGDTLTEL